MKKIIIPLAFLLVSFQLSAQKSIPDAVKAIDKAKAETENPKKASNPASWVKLANAYLGYYNVPVTGLLVGTGQLQMKLLLKDQPVISSAPKEINGVNYTADTYSDKVIYYDEKGNLTAWEIKENSIQNPLDKAYDALQKAVSLDEKNSQNKNILESMKQIAGNNMNEARNSYYLGNMESASNYFEKAALISENPVIGVIDSMSIYNTAFTSFTNKNFAKAEKYFQRCADLGYVKDGDVFASLAECYKAEGDTLKSKTTLETGFAKYPTSQSILVSLINTYLESKDDPAKVLKYIKSAQENEPSNASLYLAEGNTYVKLNDFDNALLSYKKSTEVNPEYAVGYFYIGKTYYDKALKIQETAANELDDAKYNAMMDTLEKSLEAAVEPFEKTFETSKEGDLKGVAAEYLRNIYYRFRDKDPKAKENYEKYNTYLNGGTK